MIDYFIARIKHKILVGKYMLSGYKAIDCNYGCYKQEYVCIFIKYSLVACKRQKFSSAITAAVVIKVLYIPSQ